MSRSIFVLALVVLAAVESSSKCVRSRTEDTDEDYSEFEGDYDYYGGFGKKVAAGEDERRIISILRKQIEENYPKKISSIEPIAVRLAINWPSSSSLIKALVKHTDCSEAYIHMEAIIMRKTQESIEFVRLTTAVDKDTPLKPWR